MSKLVVFFIFPVALSVSSVASADSFYRDGYAGSACVRRSSSAATSSDFTISQGRVYNWSTTSTLTVDCPALNLQYCEWGGACMQASIENARAFVLDQNYDQNVYCEVRTHDPDTDSFFYASKSSSGTNSTAQQLDLFPSTPGMTGNASNLYDTGENYYYFYCVVPPVYSGAVSGVMTYQITNRYY